MLGSSRLYIFSRVSRDDRLAIVIGQLGLTSLQLSSDLSNIFEILAELSSLEVKGLVARLGGNTYVAVN